MMMEGDIISDLVRVYFNPNVHGWAWAQKSLRTFEERQRAHKRWASLNPRSGAL